MVLGGGGGASGEYRSLQERAIHVIMILTMGYGPLGSVCNTLTCRTLHAVMFTHRFLEYMSDIWNIWDVLLSDAGLTVTAFIYFFEKYMKTVFSKSSNW